MEFIVVAIAFYIIYSTIDKVKENKHKREQKRINDNQVLLNKNPSSNIQNDISKNSTSIELINKKVAQILKDNESSSGNENSEKKDDANEILKIAISSIEIIEEYKTIPMDGRFEVILFASIFLLGEYNEKHPNKYPSTSEDYFRALAIMSKNHNLPKDNSGISLFINQRFRFYSEEIDKIYNAQNYLPGKIYYNFYKNPLSQFSDSHDDMTEILIFHSSLVQMIKYVNVKAKEIFVETKKLQNNLPN